MTELKAPKGEFALVCLPQRLRNKTPYIFVTGKDKQFLLNEAKLREGRRESSLHSHWKVIDENGDSYHP